MMLFFNKENIIKIKIELETELNSTHKFLNEISEKIYLAKYTNFLQDSFTV